jgi:thymidylate kinase
MALQEAIMAEPEIFRDSMEVGPFLEELFDSLNEAHIEYCVERNHEGLPDDLCGHDLDILLRKASIDQAVTIIGATAHKHQGRIIGAGWKTDDLKWLICAGTSASGKKWGVRIDLKPCIRWHGIDYESLDDALATAVWYGKIRVQETDRSAFFALLDNVLWGLHHSINNYGAKSVAAYQRSPKKIELLAQEAFGSEGHLLTAIFRTGRLEELDAVLPKLRRSLIVRQMRQQPFALLKHKIMVYLNYANRLFKRIGICVAVLGLDGSGKSTLCDLVRHDVEQLCHAQTDYLFLRPGFLPSLAKLLGREEQRDGPVTDPHRTPPSGLFLSIVRLAYYTLDFFLGYWVLVYPKMFRNPRIIFFDRYFYDYYWDPVRSRVDAPQWLVRFFSWFVPRPDLLVMITPHPEVFYQRKPELPLEELKRQAQEFYKFARDQKNLVWVDTTGDIESSRRVFCDAVLEAYGKQLKCQ